MSQSELKNAFQFFNLSTMLAYNFKKLKLKFTFYRSISTQLLHSLILTHTHPQSKTKTNTNIMIYAIRKRKMEDYFKQTSGLYNVKISIEQKKVFFQTNNNGILWGYVLDFKSWTHTTDYEEKFDSYIQNFFIDNCIGGKKSLLPLSKFLNELREEFC